MSDKYKPRNDHKSLGSAFFSEVEPKTFPDHTLRYRNAHWAGKVGLHTLDDQQWVQHFGRFDPMPGSLEKPLALKYHGHQFQTYNPDLGDGRGFLFAQLEDDTGRLLDLGTKGSGTTPWSRGGDGCLTLKGGVRELLATSQLEALGVNTSKTFSLIETHETLMRNDEPSPTRSAVLVRLNHSHIRIGTFQRLAYTQDRVSIAQLVDYVVESYYPQLVSTSGSERVLALLEAILCNVALTGAQWMHAGFVHGVLNTDNINITGESFDYGPWRFVAECDPSITAAYFDHSGLYAFGRQPQTLIWNLTRLAECFQAFAPVDKLEAVLETFSEVYERAFVKIFLSKMGLESIEFTKDRELSSKFWNFIETSRAPFAQTWFDWYGGITRAELADAGPNRDYYRQHEFNEVRQLMECFEPANQVDLAHPYFQSAHPQDMLINEVEAIWEAIANDDDWQPLQDKLAAIKKMKSALNNAHQ